MKVTTRFGILFLGLAVLLALGLWVITPIGPWASWLISVTLVTLGAYGYDKSIAGGITAGPRRMRVPEAVLLALGAVGGTFGALAGMLLFRHKTIKASYQIKFWLISALQVLLVAFFLRP